MAAATAAAQTAASSGVSSGALVASLTGGSEAPSMSARASALLPLVSPSARAPEQLLQEGVWRAALEYMRAECNSLRARLGDSRRNAALSLLERRPLPPTHALLLPAPSSGTGSTRGGAGVNTDGAPSLAVDVALGAASKALLDAGLVRTRRRIPLLRAGGSTSISGGAGTTAVQHVLNEACRAAAAVISVRHAEDRVFEARQQLQARVK